MPQIFHRGFNPLSKASIFGGIFIVAAIIYVFDLLYKSPYVNEKLVIREQPIPFSHRHHVNELGIDCRFCHTSAALSSFAGIPSLQTCMTCHSQIWTNAEMLEPLRRAYAAGETIKWVRVNSVPQFVYFDHSIHVNKGVACTTCHGPIDKMPLTWRQSTLEMKWCLSCHEHPGKFVSQIAGARIRKVTDCIACHR